MKVLSLFDGMACCRIALDKLGIIPQKYYASEIDKYAVQIANKNYPDIEHIGDVTKLDFTEERFKNIDLIIGGFPCQAFSVAGKQGGLEDIRGQLLYYILNAIKIIKPKYYILENVKGILNKKFKHVLDLIYSELPGIQHILINSSLLSAQNRERIYFTNFKVTQPKDKGILLKDILNGSGQIVDKDKSYCVDANYFKGGNLKSYFEKHRRQLVFNINPEHKPKLCKNYVQWDVSGKGYNSQQDRAFYTNGKMGTIPSTRTSNKCKVLIVPEETEKGYSWRKLTPIECERLQTVPDNYTEKLYKSSYLLYNKEEVNNKGEISCNAKLKDVSEKLQHTNLENSVFYIIRDIKDTEKQSFLKENITPIKNVNIAIEKLGKKVAEQEECVIDITKIGIGTATHYIQTELELKITQGVIKKELAVKIGTESFLKITLAGNLKETKLYIISILIKLIIELKIYSYVMDKAYIRFCIDNLNYLQGGLLRVELSNLRMESIRYCSDTQRYKMLGNGFTVDVIIHILKEMLNGRHTKLPC